MKISGDMAVKLALGAVVLGAGVYVAWRVKNGASDLISWAGSMVPNVVKEGADASWQLAKLGGNIVAHPLDTFGIAPADNNGQPTWRKTTPWTNTTADATSSNDSGINFNYF